MKNTEKKAKTLTWYLNNFLKKKKKAEKKNTFLGFEKYHLSFTDVEFHDSLFEEMLSNITISNGKNEKIWIYLHYTHFT